MLSLNRSNGSCNTLDVLSSRICAPNKTDDVNLDVFNMIRVINELKVWKSSIFSVDVKLLENVNQIKSRITMNVVASVKN